MLFNTSKIDMLEERVKELEKRLDDLEKATKEQHEILVDVLDVMFRKPLGRFHDHKVPFGSVYGRRRMMPRKLHPNVKFGDDIEYMEAHGFYSPKDLERSEQRKREIELSDWDHRRR